MTFSILKQTINTKSVVNNISEDATCYNKQTLESKPQVYNLYWEKVIHIFPIIKYEHILKMAAKIGLCYSSVTSIK
jgi:hypothetical protein